MNKLSDRLKDEPFNIYDGTVYYSVAMEEVLALEAEVEAANRQRSRSNAAVVIAQEALEVAVPDADMRNALIVQVDEIQSLRARLAALEERAIPDYAEAHFRRLMEDEAEQADPETEPPFSWRLAWKWLNGLETDTPEVEPA
jgi:hypothetical protein